MSVLKKAIGFIRRLADDFHTTKQLSLSYACTRLWGSIFGRMGMTRISDRLNHKKALWMNNYLQRCLQPVLEKFRNDEAVGVYVPNAPIWVCWWTGEETAPLLVRRCIRSIRENAGTHPVHVITEKNYSQYLQIPDYLLEKLENKQIGLAHLADYIRVKLLAEQGGLWLDATIYCADQVPSLCFELPFFTEKSPRTPCGYVSEMRWVTFCLGGWKGNVVYRFLTEAFEKYWQDSPCAVDYLFFDTIIDMAVQQIPAAARLLDAVPCNNLHRDDLQAAMNAALPAGEWENVLHPDTTLYKLSWRENYALKGAQGGKSVYAAFIEDILC